MDYKKELQELAKNTDDRDHGTSCILVSKRGEIIESSNNLTENIKPLKNRTERPMKYHWISHSEVSVIAKSAKYGVVTDYATMYMRWFPCQECAKSIVNAGIKKLYCDPKYEEIERYQFGIAEQILIEGGVEILDIEKL